MLVIPATTKFSYAVVPKVRQHSSVVRKIPWQVNRETETAEQNGRVIHSQVQVVSRAEGPKFLAGGQHWESKDLTWPFLPGDNIKASVVFQHQAQKSSRTRWAMPEPSAMRKDRLPCH